MEKKNLRSLKSYIVMCYPRTGEISNVHFIIKYQRYSWYIVFPFGIHYHISLYMLFSDAYTECQMDICMSYTISSATYNIIYNRHYVYRSEQHSSYCPYVYLIGVLGATHAKQLPCVSVYNGSKRHTMECFQRTENIIPKHIFFIYTLHW